MTVTEARAVQLFGDASGLAKLSCLLPLLSGALAVFELDAPDSGHRRQGVPTLVLRSM